MGNDFLLQDLIVDCGINSSTERRFFFFLFGNFGPFERVVVRAYVGQPSSPGLFAELERPFGPEVASELVLEIVLALAPGPDELVAYVSLRAAEKSGFVIADGDVVGCVGLLDAVIGSHGRLCFCQ